MDTNVLVYAADVRAPEHERCLALIERWRKGSAAWFVTWGICYEFLRVVTHPRVLRNPWPARDAHRFVEALIASPGLEILVQTDRHRDVLREVMDDVPGIAGNLWHDTETATLMREHGVRRICTRDTHFHRYGFLEPIDPMTADI